MAVGTAVEQSLVRTSAMIWSSDLKEKYASLLLCTLVGLQIPA
jgi:hypothetical protein